MWIEVSQGAIHRLMALPSMLAFRGGEIDVRQEGRTELDFNEIAIRHLPASPSA